MFHMLRIQKTNTLRFGGRSRPRPIVLICSYSYKSDFYCGCLATLPRDRHTGATEYWSQCRIRNFGDIYIHRYIYIYISVPSRGVRPVAVVVLCPSVPSSSSVLCPFVPSCLSRCRCRRLVSVRPSLRRPSSVRPSRCE